jgi:hypothetical protein
VTFGGVTDDEALQTLDLFARFIMPAFGPRPSASDVD